MEDTNSDPWFQDHMTVERRREAEKCRSSAMTRLITACRLTTDTEVMRRITEILQYDKEVQTLGGKGINDAWN